MARNTDVESISDLIVRAQDARTFIETAKLEASLATMDAFSLFGTLTNRQLARIRRSALSEYAAKQGVSVATLRNDERIEAAMSLIEDEHSDVAVLIDEDRIGMTVKELLALTALPKHERANHLHSLYQAAQQVLEQQQRFGSVVDDLLRKVRGPHRFA